MKKTTASLCLLISIASAPALAERNPADPYEGYNRTVSKFNDKADKYVLSPVARGYRKVTPKPVRTGVINFFNNLRDVVSFGSNVLRPDFHTRAGRWGTIGLQAINTREELLDLTDSLEGAAIDKYSYTRDLYMKVRTQQTGGTLPQSEDDNIDIDDLVDSDAPAATDFAEPFPQSAAEFEPIPAE